MLRDDPLSNILYIDLSSRNFWIKHRPKLFERYIGGAGVGSILLQEECPQGTGPLSPENPIIFAVGPLVGLFPMASKTVAFFKSPLTGELGESHAGGRSATSIRMAGYGAIVIKGRSKIPIYLVIEGDRVYFKDGRGIWGMSSADVARTLRERERGAGIRTIMRIGVGGEKMVHYACVTAETYRHFGRLGLGAVFGSKNLKAIVISGKRNLPVADKKNYRNIYDKIFKKVISSPSLKKYHDLGTSLNISILNKIKALPTCNLKSSTFKGAERLSGGYLAENFLGRRVSCIHCPIACIHLAALREPYEDEPYFYKTTFISYDYELLYALGSMLGIDDPNGLLKLLNEIEALGLDAISTGVILAWATEAYEHNLITKKETLGMVPKWGDYQTYMAMVRHIVSQENHFYNALARGVAFSSSMYGGREFALAFGKNEMPGYHTGYGSHLTFLTGARHSHLDSGGHNLDREVLGKEGLNPRFFAERLLKEECYRQILSSLIICFFGRKVYTYEVISRALKVAGFDFDVDQLIKIGEEILRQKYLFKMREGFSFEGLSIPRRILETPSPFGLLKEGFLREAILLYKKMLLGGRGDEV